MLNANKSKINSNVLGNKLTSSNDSDIVSNEKDLLNEVTFALEELQSMDERNITAGT